MNRPRPACEDRDPDLWFSVIPADRVQAQMICAGCPVVLACLDLAIRGGERFGVWGGVDLEEPRRASRRAFVPLGRPRKAVGV